MGLSAATNETLSPVSPTLELATSGWDYLRASKSLRRICGLSSLGLFDGMTSADLQIVAETAVIRGFERGDLVLRGNAPDECVILIQGRASISKPRTVANGELGLGLLGPGDLISATCWARHDRGLEGEVVALEACVVAFLPRSTLDALVTRHPVFAIRLLEAVAKRLQCVMDLSAQNACLDVGDRLYRCLVHLSATRGLSLPDGRLVIDHGLRQSEIAASIGATRESVNRQFAAWRRKGIIEPVRNRVMVTDVQRWSMSVSSAVRVSVIPTADCTNR